MPSFSDVMSAIVTFLVLSTASGYGDTVWKAVAKARGVAISNARQDWGCPSIFAGAAGCKGYKPSRYR